jgi:uncharacterized protein YuzE
MATQLKTIDPTPFLRLAADIVGLPIEEFSASYDRQADVLYLTFDASRDATDSEMRDDGVLVRYRDDRVIGLTVLNASTRRSP